MTPVTEDRRRTLTINEACVVSHVSRRTIYNWLQQGKLEVVKTPSGRLRIFEDSLWRPA
jgi:excisionase family DNA binding protein